MPEGLKRYHGGGDLHFITCSCYRRQRLLGSRNRRDLFLKVLEEVRRRYQLVVVGYVVMPEHIHLLLSEPQERSFSTAMQALKLGFTRRVLGAQKRRGGTTQDDLFEHLPQRIWQSRYHDFNVRTGKKIAGKPVKRGLAASGLIPSGNKARCESTNGVS